MSARRQQGEGPGRYLPPLALQLTGILLLIGASVFWAITGHQSALVMSGALSLIAMGAYSGIHVSIRQDVQRNRERRREDEPEEEREPWKDVPFE